MKNYKRIFSFITTIVIVLSTLNITLYASNDNTNETLIYKKLVGETRYDTSILVSKEAYSKGAKNIILVNGTSNIDGIPATILANKLSAPILLTQADKLSEEIKNEIKRLDPDKAYLIGGTSVISNSVKNELSKMGISTERVYGSTRYTTATAIAKKVGTFDEVVICNSRDNGVNVSAVAGIAAQNNMPILYNDSTTQLNSTTYSFVKSYAKTIYMVGNGMSSSQQKELNKCGISIINIKSTDPQEINVEMLKKFNTSYDDVVLVNNSIDAIAVSYLAAKNKSLFLYTGNNLTEKQKDIVESNEISKIYYSGGGKIKGPVKDVINILQNIKTSETEINLNKSKVVFYVPHQDDETLYFGQTILKAIKEKGHENVYVVMLSDGASSGIAKRASVQKTLKQKGITFTKARDNEYLAACLALGLERANILFNEDLGFDRMKDGGLQADSIKETMLYFENKFDGDVTHITYTFEYDYHSDHLECGKALNELYYDLDIKEESFTSVYFIVRANYEVEEDNTKIITLKEINFGDRLIDALNKYVYSNDSTNKDEIRIGIGYMSVSGEIDSAKANVNNNTLITNLHLPY